MGIDEHLARFAGNVAARDQQANDAANQRLAADRPQQKATEAATANIDRIACGFSEMELRLDGVLTRLGGGLPDGKIGSGGPSTSTSPSHFLGTLNSHAMKLEVTLKRLSALVDRFEELV